MQEIVKKRQKIIKTKLIKNIKSLLYTCIWRQRCTLALLIFLSYNYDKI